MTNCRDLEPLFAPYVDGQAAPHQRASVDAHIVGCRACHERVAVERVAHEVLVARREALRVCASESLRARCAAQCRRTGADGPGRFRGVSRRTWVPLSLAASLLLAVAGVFLFGLNDRVDALATELALDHARCFQSAQAHAPTVDARVAEREWSAAQGWSLRIPSSSAVEHLELREVRRCLTTSGRVAHLMYNWRGQPLSVFVLPKILERKGDVEAVDAIAEKFGNEAVMWSERGHTYVVVAKGQPSELAPVVVYVKASLR